MQVIEQLRYFESYVEEQEQAGASMRNLYERVQSSSKVLPRLYGSKCIVYMVNELSKNDDPFFMVFLMWQLLARDGWSCLHQVSGDASA